MLTCTAPPPPPPPTPQSQVPGPLPTFSQVPSYSRYFILQPGGVIQYTCNEQQGGSWQNALHVHFFHLSCTSPWESLLPIRNPGHLPARKRAENAHVISSTWPGNGLFLSMVKPFVSVFTSFSQHSSLYWN